MAEHPKEMKPIWYFVGWILFFMGTIIFLTGIYYWITPRSGSSVLAEIHPDVWWGGFMAVVGLIFTIGSKKVKIE